MVRASKALQNVFDQIARAAHPDATVLGHGESGVGQELVAAAIHTITATNADLESHVKSGIIREDLFYGLNVFHIHVPGCASREWTSL